MQLTPEQIQENWDKLISIVEDTFEGERKENLCIGLVPCRLRSINHSGSRQRPSMPVRSQIHRLERLSVQFMLPQHMLKRVQAFSKAMTIHVRQIRPESPWRSAWRLWNLAHEGLPLLPEWLQPGRSWNFWTREVMLSVWMTSMEARTVCSKMCARDLRG